MPLLDLLRFIASLAVVGYHFITFPQVDGWGAPPTEVFGDLAKVFAYGSFGVHLFFIVSGFVIFMSAWGRTIPQFVASRVSRLFPAYWAAVLLTGVLLPFLQSGMNAEVMWRRVAVNLTMLQTPFGVDHVDGVYWTLWVELCFYILVGVVLLWGFTFKRAVAIVALWPMLAILSELSGGNFFSTLLVPNYAPLFAGGMGLFLIYRFGHSVLLWLLVGLNVIIGAQQTVANWIPVQSSLIGFEISPSVTSAVIVLCFAAVAVATLTPARAWSGRAGVWLGRLTYPLYLVHVHWGFWVIGLALPVFGVWGALASAVLFVGILSWVLVRFVEKPLARPLRAGIEKTLTKND